MEIYNRHAALKIILLIFGVLLDQLSKFWVLQNFAWHHFQQVLPFANIYLTYNRGAAWSFFSEWGQGVSYSLSIVSIFVIIYLSILLWGKAAKNRPLTQSWPILFILAGAVGNVLDRLRLGAVVDFIDLHYKQYHFPIFNVADCLISCGCICLIYYSLQGRASLLEA
jgi:signal peptidase II